ncbi:general odorant-binding protein 56h-like [Ceratitis capitata]|uniref:general odorant-binding protein 56h-like n=1 Tax=Ceratitis capitata TaxID=7213 RepID=UPI00032980A1|nr:general odorant-binding protein 56h-like [Ceratitis capitata]
MKILYILITFAALATFALCDLRVEMRKFFSYCQFEANVTETQLNKFIDNGMLASEAKSNIRCLVKCTMERYGLIRNGTYDTERAIRDFASKVPKRKGLEEDVKEAVNKCKAEKGADDCDRAFKITMCIKEFKTRFPEV